MKKNNEDYYYDDIDSDNDDMISLLDKYDSIEEEQKKIFNEDNSEVKNDSDDIEVKDLVKEKKEKKKKKKIEKNIIEEDIISKPVVNDEENKTINDNESSKDNLINDNIKLVTDDDETSINNEKNNSQDKVITSENNKEDTENDNIKLVTDDETSINNDSQDEVITSENNKEDINKNDNMNNDDEENNTESIAQEEESIIKNNELYDDNDSINYEKKDNQEPNSKKKSEVPEILMSLASVASIGYYIFYVTQSLNDVNYVYKIVNSTLIIIALLCAVSAFINRNKNKKRDFMAIMVSIILVIFLGFNLMVNSKILKLPTLPVLKDYTNTSFVKVLNFTNDNKIKLKQSYEYSDNIKEGNIISQDVKPDTIVKKIKKMSVVVSNGPNYDKELVLSDFVGLKVDDVIKFIHKNFMNNVNIDFTVNDGIEKDIVISQSTKGEIKRNTKVDFSVSLGNADNLPEIEIKDLKNMTLFEATLYLKRNGIKYNLTYEFSKTVKKDHIISQDKPAKTKIKPGSDVVTLTVSYGKEIKVPDFAGKTSEDVVNWAVKNNLKVAFEEKYHVSVKKGNLIGINYEVGSSIAEGTKITITTSLGPVIVPDFPSLASLRTWASENNVNVSESYQYSTSIAKGNIIKVNHSQGTKIDPAKDSIVVEISQGSPVTVPYFVGKNKSNIQSQCRNIGLNCSFYYVGYNNNPANTAVNQNVRSGLQVVSGTYISIGLSSGPAQSFRVYIDDSYLTIGNSDASIQSIRNRLAQTAPGVTFNFSKHAVPGQASYGMIHPNSPIKGGVWNNFTQGITYNIWVIG